MRWPNKDDNTRSRWADSQHFKVSSPPTWKSQSLVLWSPPLGELLFQPFSQLHLHYSLIQALEEMELKLPTFWASTFTPRVQALQLFLLPGFCVRVYLTKEDAPTVLITISAMCPQMVSNAFQHHGGLTMRNRAAILKTAFVTVTLLRCSTFHT